MLITETSGPRLELALDLLRAGTMIVYEGIGIALREGPPRIDLWVESSYRYDLVSSRSARADAARAGRTVRMLRERSAEFAALSRGLPRRVTVIDHYGDGMIELCHVQGRALTWLRRADDLPRRRAVALPEPEPEPA